MADYDALFWDRIPVDARAEAPLRRGSSSSADTRWVSMVDLARPRTSMCGSRQAPSNAKKVMQALRDFGAPLGDLVERDLEAPGTGFKMGEPPSRIDI
jgi:hypothetical protein